MRTFKLRLAFCLLVLITVAELSSSASYANRNTEAVRCYDCDYDPMDQQNEASDRHSNYGQYGTGNGNSNAGGSEGDQKVTETNVRRGFQRCALDKSTDDQRYVRESECQYGVCFIRKDHNGLVYRGCADPKNLPLNVDPTIQCQPQGLRPAIWWFCNGTRCNSGSFEGQSGICSNTSSMNKANQRTGSSNPYVAGGQGANRGGSKDYPNSQSKPKLPMSSAYQALTATKNDVQEPFGGSSHSQPYESQQHADRVSKYETSSMSHSGNEKNEQSSSTMYASGQSRLSQMGNEHDNFNVKPSYDNKHSLQSATTSPRQTETQQIPYGGHMIAIPVISVNAAHMSHSSLQSDSAGKPPSYNADSPMNYLMFMTKLHDKLNINKENSDSYSSSSKSPIEYEMKSRSTPADHPMSYNQEADTSGRLMSMYPQYFSSEGSMDKMTAETTGYGQNENAEGMTTSMAAAATSGDASSNSGHVAMSEGDDEQQSDTILENSSPSPCDGQCMNNPSGLFPDPSSPDFFIQCGPSRDPQVGTPCQCCRPQRMRCPISTSFNHVTKVCSGSIDLANDSVSVTTESDSSTSGTAENQLPAEMIFGYN